MKRLILCTILALMTISDGVCQSVIVGDKLPSTIFQRRWLMDIQPDEADYTCILFYHSESGLCQRVLNKVKTIVEEYGSSLNLVIITKERYDKAGVTLTEHLNSVTSCILLSPKNCVYKLRLWYAKATSIKHGTSVNSLL